jgi:lactoylglutathione lyase
MNVKEVVPLLNVSSIERSVRYYVDGLGFTMKHKWVVDGKLRWCWLALGGAALMLQRPRKEDNVGAGIVLYFTCGRRGHLPRSEGAASKRRSHK